MGKMIGGLMCAALLMSSGVMAQAPVITMAVTGNQLAQANGTSNLAAAGRLAFTAEGQLVLTDFSNDNNERVYLVNLDQDPPLFTLLVTEDQLKNKVDEFTSRPSALTIRGLKVDGEGNIIIASDGAAPEKAFLFRVNPQTGELALLSGLDARTSAIEGLSALAVMGTTAYVALDGFFGAVSGDSIVAVSTAGPDGGQAAATVLVSEAALKSVVPSGDIAIRDMEVMPGSMGGSDRLVAVNSATANANDDILAVDLSTGNVSVLVAATDIEMDLGARDIGPSAMAIDPNGTIYLINGFGTGASNHGIIAVANPGDGVGTATLLASEQQIVSAPGVRTIRGQAIRTLEFISGNSLAAPRPGEVFFTEGMTDGVIHVQQP